MEYYEWDKIDLEELEKKLKGRRVRVRGDLGEIGNYLGDDNDRVYITSDMERLAGEIITIDRVYSTSWGLKYFRCQEISDNFEFGMIDAVIDDNNIQIEDDIDIEIKKGDLVRIRTAQKGKNIGKVFDLPIIAGNDIEGEKINVKFIVADIKDNIIMPYYTNDIYKNLVITKNMVELVEEGYVDRISNKKRKTEKDKKILDDLQTIEEMKSKVNVKDFKKIYAGSLMVKPNDLKGIDLLLHQWAFNKKHLYKMLGNKLSITKEIEYTKSEEDMKAEKETIYREVPVAYYILGDMNNSEILNNLTERRFEKTWCKYSSARSYPSGTKVSKILDDACKNDRLNTLFSDMIAQNKIRGTLEISINPIEILLMSCNVSGWNSCHRINEIGSNRSWGCYSGGIFSYMCDSTSMIAFRHNNKLYDFKIYNSKTQQHSKNWRQMIWINKDFTKFITSRQYPCKMDEITKQIREMLKEQINSYAEEYTWVHTNDQNKIKSEIYDYKYKGSARNVLHYNDMLNGYSGDLCYKKGEELTGNSIRAGSIPVCPYCGKEIMKTRSYPMCDDCYTKIQLF